MKILKTLFVPLVATFLMYGCSSKDSSKAIARVFDNYLYESDLQGLVPLGTSPDDSAAIVSSYIQQWIQEMVVLEKAKNNISNNFEKEIQNYKNSLITYNYECLILEQQLDTNISDSDVQNYYNKNKHLFTLKDNILRVIYVKMPIKSKNNHKIRKILAGKELSDKNIMELEQLAANQAIAYNFDPNIWISFFDFQQIIPVKTYNETAYLKKIKKIYFTDKKYTYIAKILDSKVTDDISPIDIEYPNIKNIILNKRKVDLVNNMRANLIKKAEDDNQIEIYKK
ncbi:MAG: hypothetical protein J5605_02625 [Bacteroidales bacterium]|nr:hypothetical protein [Bacteroidales bacterium]